MCFFFVYVFSLRYTKSGTPYKSVKLLYLYKTFASAPKIILKANYKL